MRVGHRIGMTLVAASIIAMYGCSQKEEPKQAAEAAPAAAAPAAATPAASTEETVTIGSAGPLTGEIAHLGKDNDNGVRLAIDQANEKHIKIGGKEIKFVVDSQDDQADPKLGPTIAQKYCDEKAAGVVGHLNSGVTIPASAVYHQCDIPMISGSATNPKLTEQGFKEIFRIVGRDDQQGPAIASYLMSQFKLKTV
ncbi:MAG: branched-chain amino acid ABC transporter substrate-binding protein, partial [Casimicrobiaceae bacterium]